jgi:glucose/arabinose dehydrogenase
VRTPPLVFSLFAVPVAFFVAVFASCNGGTVSQTNNDASVAADNTVADRVSMRDVKVIEIAPPPTDGPVAATYCDMPGSFIYTSSGISVVTGGSANAPSLVWLTLPIGFCAHYFAHVDTVRQVRVAPGGEIFVASPATPTAGGAPVGLGGIVVLVDDNSDGYADGDALPHSDGSPQNLSLFQSGLASTQGMMFAPGYFYYQDTATDADADVGTAIKRIPYKKGQRVASGTPEQIADIQIYYSSTHWPKTLDMADDGTIFVGNGGDQSETCNTDVFPRPFAGGVLKIGGTNPMGGTPVAQGFRNPIAVRCQHGHNLCFSTELALDGSGGEGGREKLVPIRPGDDWGFPCCASANLPYQEISGTPNCSHVPTEPASFVIGDTPFGLDFETGAWAAPYQNDIFVTLHGAVGSWVGARIVAIPTNSTGMPVPSSDLGSSSFDDFATGWDDGMLDHGRPAAIAFSSDGRAFIANDINGDIFWIAPVGLKTQL